MNELPASSTALSYFWCRGSCNIVVDIRAISRSVVWLVRLGPSFKYPSPPHRRVKWFMTIMQGWINISKEVPYMANDNAAYFILRYSSMYNKAESHQHPRKIRSSENQKTQETESGLWISAAPYIHQAGGKG